MHVAVAGSRVALQRSRHVLKKRVAVAHGQRPRRVQDGVELFVGQPNWRHDGNKYRLAGAVATRQGSRT
jgi:hypothetical protein